MKYAIRLKDGQFVERFYKLSVLLTGNIKRAGNYRKHYAENKIKDLGLIGARLELITSEPVFNNSVNESKTEPMKTQIARPEIADNNPNQAGQKRSAEVRFGDFGRYSIFCVHTRFVDAPEMWVVTDAEQVDKDSGLPKLIAMDFSFEDAIARVPE